MLFARKFKSLRIDRFAPDRVGDLPKQSKAQIKCILFGVSPIK